MPSTQESQDKRGVFALIKGDPGAGKSVIGLSFPSVYNFDFDYKMPAISLKHFPEKEVFWDTFTDIFKVADKIEELKDECPHETLIFDSYTSLNALIMKTIGDSKGERIVEQLRKINAAKNKNIETQSIDYYNGALRWTQNYFIDEIRKLWSRPGNPKHVLLIAHVMTIEHSPKLGSGQEHGRITRSIVTAGKAIAAYIPAQFDNEFYVYKSDADANNAFGPSQGLKHICATVDVGDDSARTAYNLPERIDFTGKNFYELIKDKL